MKRHFLIVFLCFGAAYCQQVSPVAQNPDPPTATADPYGMTNKGTGFFPFGHAQGQNDDVKTGNCNCNCNGA